VRDRQNTNIPFTSWQISRPEQLVRYHLLSSSRICRPIMGLVSFWKQIPCWSAL